MLIFSHYEKVSIRETMMVYIYIYIYIYIQRHTRNLPRLLYKVICCDVNQLTNESVPCYDIALSWTINFSFKFLNLYSYRCTYSYYTCTGYVGGEFIDPVVIFDYTRMNIVLELLVNTFIYDTVQFHYAILIASFRY